jgi:hypothetical protein
MNLQKAKIWLFASIFLFVLVSCKDKRAFTVGKIKDAAKLATTETTVEKIVIGTKEKKILRFIPLGQARFVCFSQAIIKAGIDLKKIQAKNITIKGKSIELELPPVEVINFSYPFDRFYIDSTLLDNGLFVKIHITDMEEFYRQAEMDIREQLPLMGIIEETEKKTSQLMESLLKSLGYEEIYITFRKGPLLPKVTINDLR